MVITMHILQISNMYVEQLDGISSYSSSPCKLLEPGALARFFMLLLSKLAHSS